MKKILFLVLILSMMTGCTNAFNDEEGYRMSLINYSFPVPKNASQMRPEVCTGQISKSAKYKLRNIGGKSGEEPQQRYLDEIEDWGWIAMEGKSSDSVRFFERDSVVISVLFDKNVIDVFEMSMDK
ncbi:hypothetical protein ACXYMX_08125 [Sporosarcina sp. CAU 1771]